MTTNPLDFFRSLPPSDTNDASKISGNVSTDDKWLNANFLKHIAGRGDAFGAKIAARIQVVQIDVCKREGSEMEARVVCEIEVKEDMLNSYETVHGGCAAFLVDMFTVLPVLALGISDGEDLSGMSQNLSVVYHSAPRVGTVMRSVGTTITVKGGLMASRCEVYDKSTERILFSGVHTLVKPGKKFSHHRAGKL